MSDDNNKDWKVILSDQVEGKMAEDPKVAEFIRDMNARLRQALDGVDHKDIGAVTAALRSVGLEQMDDDEAERFQDKMSDEELKRKLSQ